jgi:hypothetical protein
MSEELPRVCAWPECGALVDHQRYGPRRGPKATKYCMRHRLIRRHGPNDGQTIYERIIAARARAGNPAGESGRSETHASVNGTLVPS